MKMGPKRCPETSVRNYTLAPRNIPEEQDLHIILLEIICDEPVQESVNAPSLHFPSSLRLRLMHAIQCQLSTLILFSTFLDNEHLLLVPIQN
jgi:hypothetical protein